MLVHAANPLATLGEHTLCTCQVMTLALVGAKRQLGVAPEQLRVGKPHGAEGGYDPHSAYKDLNDDNFFGYLCGKILDPEVATEWVSGEGGGWCVTRHQMSRRLRRHRAYGPLRGCCSPVWRVPLLQSSDGTVLRGLLSCCGCCVLVPPCVVAEIDAEIAHHVDCHPRTGPPVLCVAVRCA